MEKCKNKKTGEEFEVSDNIGGMYTLKSAKTGVEKTLSKDTFKRWYSVDSAPADAVTPETPSISPVAVEAVTEPIEAPEKMAEVVGNAEKVAEMPADAPKNVEKVNTPPAEEKPAEAKAEPEKSPAEEIPAPDIAEIRQTVERLLTEHNYIIVKKSNYATAYLAGKCRLRIKDNLKGYTVFVRDTDIPSTLRKYFKGIVDKYFNKKMLIDGAEKIGALKIFLDLLK